MTTDGARGERSLLNRAAKTLVYFPFEGEHETESPATAWLLIACCLGLGLLASFDNVWAGIVLAVGCLYGSALVRALIALRTPASPAPDSAPEDTGSS